MNERAVDSAEIFRKCKGIKEAFLQYPDCFDLGLYGVVEKYGKYIGKYSINISKMADPYFEEYSSEEREPEEYDIKGWQGIFLDTDYRGFYLRLQDLKFDVEKRNEYGDYTVSVEICTVEEVNNSFSDELVSSIFLLREREKIIKSYLNQDFSVWLKYPLYDMNVVLTGSPFVKNAHRNDDGENSLFSFVKSIGRDEVIPDNARPSQTGPYEAVYKWPAEPFFAIRYMIGDALSDRGAFPIADREFKSLSYGISRLLEKLDFPEGSSNCPNDIPINIIHSYIINTVCYERDSRARTRIDHVFCWLMYSLTTVASQGLTQKILSRLPKMDVDDCERVVKEIGMKQCSYFW